MKMLHNWLAKENIYLEIKRGEKAKRNQKSIKNDELGQLILSFAYQQPEQQDRVRKIYLKMRHFTIRYIELIMKKI